MEKSGGRLCKMTLSTPSHARGGSEGSTRARFSASGREGFSADYVRFRPLIAVPSVTPISGSRRYGKISTCCLVS